MVRTPERRSSRQVLEQVSQEWFLVCDGVYTRQSGNGVWVVQGHESDLKAALKNGVWSENPGFRAALLLAYQAAEREFHF